MTLEERQERMRRRMLDLPGPRNRPQRFMPVSDEHTIAVARTFLDVPAPYLPSERVDISRRLLAELIALAEIGAKTKAGESQ